MLRKTLLIYTLFMFSFSFTFAQTFVDIDATGAGDGSTWEDAYVSLSAALADSSATEVWIAEGRMRGEER